MQLVSVLIGVLVGGMLSFAVQRLESQRNGRLVRTHRLYELWQSADNIILRAKAVEMLRRNMELSKPLSFMELMDENDTPKEAEDRFAVTRILHFFEESGALLETRAIDIRLYRRLLERYVIYWVDGYLKPLYEVSARTDEEIDVGWYRQVELLRSAIEK